MITGMEIAACQHMAVPAEVMQHIVNVESGYNPFAIGVVGGQLMRQPQNLGEAVATVQMLESKGYNFSLGLAQVNRANLGKYGLTTYEQAFDICPNLNAGARILSQCYASSGNDWGKSFSCYYSGNFITGYQDGYVQKVYDSINRGSQIAMANSPATAIPLQQGDAQKMASRGAGRLPAPLVANDSALYRVAIRSTLLDTAAAMATAPLAAAIAPATSTPAAATQTAAPAMPPVPDSALAASAPTPGGAAPAADIFVPQVSSLGDPPPAEPTAGASSAAATASTPSAPPADRADLRQGNRDDAFVF